jgi:hypothetical protein
LEQPTRPVDLRDDGVDIDLPNREEIEEVLKYLKNNKAAEADSDLVDEVITKSDPRGLDETLPSSWTKGALCPVYKKRAINSIVTTYRGICFLNVTYKVFAKILYNCLLPHANAAVQHYQAGFQSGKSTTDQLFALRQILEKCNGFNITIHHLFIDF